MTREYQEIRAHESQDVENAFADGLAKLQPDDALIYCRDMPPISDAMRRAAADFEARGECLLVSRPTNRWMVNTGDMKTGVRVWEYLAIKTKKKSQKRKRKSA